VKQSAFACPGSRVWKLCDPATVAADAAGGADVPEIRKAPAARRNIPGRAEARLEGGPNLGTACSDMTLDIGFPGGVLKEQSGGRPEGRRAGADFAKEMPGRADVSRPMPRRLTQEFLFAGAIALVAGPAHAAAISGGAGVDYQAGPDAQSYRGALLFGSADLAPGNLTVAAIRYEDSRLGPGIGGFANAGVNIASAFRLRVIGLRTIGDHGFDAWRLRGGPERSVGTDATLGAYYLRLHDDAPENFDAAGFELTVPVLRGLSAQAGASYGRWSGGATTLQATLAGTFRAGARVELLSEIDVGRNVTTTSSPSSSGGIWSGLPLAKNLGNGGSATGSRTDLRINSAGQLGARFLIP